MGTSGIDYCDDALVLYCESCAHRWLLDDDTEVQSNGDGGLNAFCPICGGVASVAEQGQEGGG